jgi:hypothetical protein
MLNIELCAIGSFKRAAAARLRTLPPTMPLTGGFVGVAEDSDITQSMFEDTYLTIHKIL